MQWVNALSTQASLEAAVREVVERATAQLDGAPDLAIVFISAAFGSEYSRLMALMRDRLWVPALVGCGGGGIIGQGADGRIQELEDVPALSLTLAKLPTGATVRAFHVPGDRMPDLDAPPDAWVELVGVAPEQRPNFILLADPALREINDLVQGLDFAYPGSVTVGGLASGGPMPTARTVFHNYSRHQEGTVGLALAGKVTIEPIVAQGCRPIGEPFRVVESDRNVMIAIADANGDGRDKPLFALRKLVDTLDEGDRELAQSALFVGIARDEFRTTLRPGDFLIRNLMGYDPESGALAVGDRIRPGQRIQFHLRDAQASAQDLTALLEQYCHEQDPCKPAPIGALLFACLGRGENLYEEAHFDSRLFQKYVGEIPVSGFFCNGELGPVGGSTFVHGYTSVFGIIRERD